MCQPACAASADQILRERAAGQVSDVLLNPEYTLAKARKGHKIVQKDGVDTNAELSLGDPIKELERELVQRSTGLNREIREGRREYAPSA